jgi:RHS repeat-associated protein
MSIVTTGSAVCATSACRNKYHFTGKERDTESGNDYFGARYYASSMGRYMSPDYSDDDNDPDPVPYADLMDPQSLNLYSYAGNNPMSYFDEDGHQVAPAQICTPRWLCAITHFFEGLFRGGGGGSSSNGDTGPSVRPPSNPNYTPQLHTRPAASVSGTFSNQRAAAYADSHACARSQHQCGHYVANAIEFGGGLRLGGRPRDAKNFGPMLLQHGYHVVSDGDYLEQGHEQVGDVVVFQQVPRHNASGHIEMWDGAGWVSDFRQHHFSPYNGVPPSAENFTIYRHD